MAHCANSLGSSALTIRLVIDGVYPKAIKGKNSKYIV
jgi:hypothetical protein